MKRKDNFIIKENINLGDGYHYIKLQPEKKALPADVFPGQFVEIYALTGKTFLRRPISICDYDRDCGLLTLLVKEVGDGTRYITELDNNAKMDIVWPLGKGFSIPERTEDNRDVLLCGGGVGVAPLYFLGKELKKQGFSPIFALGARTVSQIKLLDDFDKIGNVFITTDDGTLGTKGVITCSEVFNDMKFNKIYVCGPTPMMKAVAKQAFLNGIPCEVSLENMMACGLGACLGCVEKTKKGNICVCSDGPVFDINLLNWDLS